MTDLPSSFEQLMPLDRKTLRKIHEAGKCPDLNDIEGVAKGIILDPVWFECLRLWRGKAFSKSAAGDVEGKNILGVGLISFQRYRFNVTSGKSAFSDQRVAFLNHDHEENPDWVRRFHDEMVELQPGFYLACSHYKARDSLRYMSYFAFDFR